MADKDPYTEPQTLTYVHKDPFRDKKNSNIAQKKTDKNKNDT